MRQKDGGEGKLCMEGGGFETTCGIWRRCRTLKIKGVQRLRRCGRVNDLGGLGMSGLRGSQNFWDKKRERLAWPLPFPVYVYPESGSNRHDLCSHWCLRPARLPIPPSGHFKYRGANLVNFTFGTNREYETDFEFCSGGHRAARGIDRGGKAGG